MAYHGYSDTTPKDKIQRFAPMLLKPTIFKLKTLGLIEEYNVFSNVTYHRIHCYRVCDRSKSETMQEINSWSLQRVLLGWQAHLLHKAHLKQLVSLVQDEEPDLRIIAQEWRRQAVSASCLTTMLPNLFTDQVC